MMLNKLLFVGALALAPVLMSETASADHCRRGYAGYGYGGGFGGAVIGYRAPIYGHPGHYRAYRPPYHYGPRYPYHPRRGGFYRSGYGYRGYGGGIGIYGRGVGVQIGW